MEWSGYWLVLLGFMAFLTYGAFAISKENITYKQDSWILLFGDFRLMIPNWWTPVKESPKELRFERTDTHYDWFCTLRLVDSEERLETLLDRRLESDQIGFDPEVAVESYAQHLFKDAALLERIISFVRIEGMASVGTERHYLDLVWIRTDRGVYEFESNSSVLNGSVEGPYFEEMLKLAELALEPSAEG